MAPTAVAETEKWDRLQATVHERLDRSCDYVDTVAHVVDTLWTFEQRREAEAALRAGDSSSPLFTVLIDDFDVRTHYALTDSHRAFVARSYERLADRLEAMSAAQAAAHDLTKYGLAEAVGYTLRWVHGRDGEPWRTALGHHYCAEPHHPQWFTLARTGSGRMSAAALQESLVDMVACRWERQLAGRDDVTDRELVEIGAGYLERYVPEDRAEVVALMERIAGSSPVQRESVETRTQKQKR